MKSVIVLAMHGMPPNDFPAEERREFMRLRSKLLHSRGQLNTEDKKRHDELDAKVRHWPRNEKNDLFHAAAVKLAGELENMTRQKVFLGFNEFCAPALELALEEAAQSTPQAIQVITPMMTRGGSHSESEIPQAIKAAKSKHPEITFQYAWPFETSRIARFLTDQIRSSLQAQ